MKKYTVKTKADESIVIKYINGSMVLSGIIDNRLITVHCYYYTEKEAIKLFKKIKLI